jgi:hypothetical protein
MIPGSSARKFSLIVTVPGSVQTGEAIHVGEEECTLSTLQGTYRQIGFTPPGPRSASVGFRIADGNGSYYGEDTQSVGGDIRHRVVTAEYTVNGDCTGTTTASIGHYDSVYVANGAEKFDVPTDPGVISLGRFQRESRHREDD